MPDWLPSSVYLVVNLLNHLPHLVSAAQNVPGLLVLLCIELHLVEKLRIHQLVLMDYPQQPIYLSIKNLMIFQKLHVLVPEFVLFPHDFL